MTPKEFVSLWGSGDMVHPPAAVLDSGSLGEANTTFLREAGLPRQAGLQLDFSALERGLPSLGSVLEAKGLPLQAKWAEYRVLGQDNASYLCLEPGPEGVITALWPRERLQRFVNTDIPRLAECLLAYRQISKGSDHLNDNAYASDLRRYIERVDPIALDDEESWWSVVVEQASHGDL
jgi:hypothetical protein